jgi:hypothetical protein
MQLSPEPIVGLVRFAGSSMRRQDSTRRGPHRHDPYEEHVRDLIEQLPLTSPGERVQPARLRQWPAASRVRHSTLRITVLAVRPPPDDAATVVTSLRAQREPASLDRARPRAQASLSAR